VLDHLEAWIPPLKDGLSGCTGPGYPPTSIVPFFPPETPCAVYPLCVTSSDGSDVLVEQPTEAIKTLHRAVSNRYRVGPFAGPALPEALVWPRLGYVTFGEEEKVWP
jgi:hypothetical protein